MKKLLPLIIALIGLGAGAGVGLMLKPAAPDDGGEPPLHDASAKMSASGDCSGADDAADEKDLSAPDPEDLTDSKAYARLANQFVVPVVVEGKVSSLVVLSLSLEVDPGFQEEVYSREPKLRDAILQVLFQHAHAGGFEGEFTAGTNMRDLRMALDEVVGRLMGPKVKGVLITDIVRQDV